MNLRVRVGLNIQNTRYSRKLSQEALALSAGIDRSYISEIELAKSSVSLDILERLGLATFKFRSLCSFMRPFFRMPRGFC
ncbi:helix-turn-helix transcriptional regulator, partial [Thalassobius sp. I31.1]|uniref:helix-turn-helix domain-containing protein n=1 Tax=Thalassobius sp. I31.1 TaxID=2109912 RepID=UPI000D1AB0CA